MGRVWRTWALVMGMVAFGSEVAEADSATESLIRFTRGLDQYKRGRVQDALDNFFISYRLSPNPNTLFNIGACLEDLSRFDEAFSAYSEYLTFELEAEERTEGGAALERVVPKVARLTVTSDPPGAAIFVDRKSRGQHGVTPRTFAVPAGKHAIIVVAERHHPATREVDVVVGEAARLDVSLTAIEGAVAVSSQPPGATIRTAGPQPRTLGTTPATVQLPLGEHRLSLVLDGYAPRDERVLVRADRTAQITARLSHLPPPKGRVRILTNVASALIGVDGRDVGFSPQIIQLPRGSHQIVVHKPGYRPWRDAVTVEPDRPVAVEVTLEPLEQETGRGPWPWVLLWATGLAGAGWAGFGIAALDTASTYERAPTQALLDQGGTLNTLTDVAMSVTALAGVTTAALFVFGEDKAERASTAVIAYPASVTTSTLALVAE